MRFAPQGELCAYLHWAVKDGQMFPRTSCYCDAQSVFDKIPVSFEDAMLLSK